MRFWIKSGMTKRDFSQKLSPKKLIKDEFWNYLFRNFMKINLIAFNKTLKEVIKHFFITISILFVCFLILNLKGIDGDFDNFFEVLGSVGSIIISIGLLKIGIEANKIAKEQNRKNDFEIWKSKKIIRNYHEKLSLLTAKSYNYWFGRNFNKDPQNKGDPTIQLLGLFNSSKIELPEELSLLIEEIFLFYSSIVAPTLLDATEKNIALGNKLSEMYKSESELRLKMENLFTKYLKIPNLNN